MSKVPSRVYSDIAKKHGLTDSIVEHIVNHQFRFVVNTMKKRKYESIRLHYLGVFGVEAKRLYFIKKNQERKKEKEKNEYKSVHQQDCSRLVDSKDEN